MRKPREKRLIGQKPIDGKFLEFDRHPQGLGITGTRMLYNPKPNMFGYSRSWIVVDDAALEQIKNLTISKE